MAAWGSWVLGETMLAPFIRPARAAVALLFALGLAGCFDFEEHLTIKGSGGGQTPGHAANGSVAARCIRGQDAPRPAGNTRRSHAGGKGRPVHPEGKGHLQQVPELRVRNETLSITNEGSTFFGIGPKKLTLRRIIDNSGADPDSLGVMKGVFQDRTYTYTVTLQGWIEKAYPVVVNGEAINPIVDGATVKWQIPMAKAISAARLDYRSTSALTWTSTAT